jgi:stage II sporulation protein AA (anti-sigma F factor antagonist)
MKLSIQADNGDAILLILEGRVSQRDVELSDPFVDTVGESVYSRNVLLNMSEVASLDSSGVNWLLMSQKRMREGGGQLVLHSLSPISMNVLKVLNLHTLLKLADSESAALRLLEGNA